jgi:hypothetical protein
VINLLKIANFEEIIMRWANNSSRNSPLHTNGHQNILTDSPDWTRLLTKYNPLVDEEVRKIIPL